VIWHTALPVVGALGLLLFLAVRRHAAGRRRRGHPTAGLTPPHAGPAADQVLTWMRHEIRTPINAVVGMADLLLDGDLVQKQREYLGLLRSSAESLSRTFDDLVDLCRIDAGRLTLDSQPLNLREAVELSLDRVAPMAAERALDLSCNIAPGTPEIVLGDATRLRQIMTILLTDAFRRTHQGGVFVSVSAKPGADGHLLRFAVRDSGIPVPSDRARAVLQPLSRIVRATGSVADSEDLGLALCHGLAGLMGGTLALLPADGPGSTFELTVTARTPDRVLEASRSWRRERPGGVGRGPLRILLAEDSEVGRAVAVDVLQRLGHVVDVAGDGLLVLEALERRHYDVVLMDMNMPRMDGVTATREICRRMPPDRRPRILALSASDLPEDRALWVAAGADGWVSKTLPPDELKRVLGGSAYAGPASRLRNEQMREIPGGAPHVDMFVRESSRLLLLLRDAVECQDTAAAERVAHTLKGSAAMIGAGPVAQGCTELLREVQGGRFDGAARVLARMDVEIAALQRNRVLPVPLDGARTAPAGPIE